MAKGYMGKILNVNLSNGEMRDEDLDENILYDFIGGYGIGARILYSRQKVGIDPLGPDNMLGFLTGPLTATAASFAARLTVVAKSPITGGWGDSNCGGHFAPYLKFAGYDGVFFTGVAEKPVYLFIDNGVPALKDATHLWGKDCFITEDTLKEQLGGKVESVCIGPPGEKRSLLSCIVTRRGAVAGRSGLGAVMGAKMLKAVAVRGDQKVPIFDKKGMMEWKKRHVAAMKGPAPEGSVVDKLFPKYGTSHVVGFFAHAGNAPIKNWGGVGVVDLPDTGGLNGDAAIANAEKKAGCWHCIVGCESKLKAGVGKYLYPRGTRRVEYETQASFGTMCLNNDAESLNMVNHLCNCYGLDTISAGCTIAFAIECYENGILSRDDTDGIDLTWGNIEAIVAMTQKMVNGEGLGRVLADGCKVAAEKIGKGSEQYAIHIGGQELGMHDPKFHQHPGAFAAARYLLDATPGRHTQLSVGPSGFFVHLYNATGWCLLADLVAADSMQYIQGFINAITGWQRSMDDLMQAGERIANIRHAFNLREGINPLDWKIPDRVIGNPPQKDGPLAGVSADAQAQIYWTLGALDWDRHTTIPSKKKLLALGLDDVAEDFWPAGSAAGGAHE